MNRHCVAEPGHLGGGRGRGRGEGGGGGERGRGIRLGERQIHIMYIFACKEIRTIFT